MPSRRSFSNSQSRFCGLSRGCLLSASSVALAQFQLTNLVSNQAGQGAVPAQAGSQSLPMVRFFGIPTQDSWPMYIRNGPDGNLWFTEYYGNNVARITPTGTVTEFPVLGGDVDAIVTGPDGNLWITEPGANNIGRMTTQGMLTNFTTNGTNPVPTRHRGGPGRQPSGSLNFTTLALAV